jgi:hypothetical protein
MCEDLMSFDFLSVHSPTSYPTLQKAMQVFVVHDIVSALQWVKLKGDE